MDRGYLWYGGDYNPEQWLGEPEILDTDLEYLLEAGINTVTLGVFSWSFLEPEEGVFCLDWMKDRIDLLYKNGISVILATPSGARPRWMTDKYEEVLRVDETRRRQLFGGRHNHCYTSPVYREKVRRINQELGRTFGNHPAVKLWHISNEYGGECHCPLCQQAFREWLQEKYGTIEKLNESWYTAFWSHTYRSFDQIESPSSIGESMVHGQNLDWKRFVTSRTADFAAWEAEALKEAGALQPVTANLMYDFKGLNYEKLASVIDVVSWDSYPLWHKEKEIRTARDTGMQHDFMRSLKNQPFLLMESSPGSTNWQGISKLRKPGMLSLASWQAIAHGSDSVLYFQIRQSRGSSEKFHSAVIDHRGEKDSRIFKEVCGLGKELSSLGELAGIGVKARAAVLYDTENRWAMEDAQGPRNKGLFYHETCLKIYSAIRKLGCNVDVITMEADLSGYELVAAPMLYLYRRGIEEKLEMFVKSGGTLVGTYWSGVVDENDRCFLGETPHKLTEVFGLRREEIDGLYDWEKNDFVPVSGAAPEKRYPCRNLCELDTLKGAEALMVYGGDFYEGRPALTRNKYGNGTAYYVCGDAGQKFYNRLLKRIAREHGLKSLIKGKIPKTLEVSSRESEEFEYLFLQNFSREPVKLSGETLKDLEPGTVLLGTIGGNGEMDGFETVIVRKQRDAVPAFC